MNVRNFIHMEAMLQFRMALRQSIDHRNRKEMTFFQVCVISFLIVITFNIAFLGVDCKKILDELKKKK